MPGPLEGIRVIDLTHVLAGPHCTMMLADAGAEVIKVEPPGGESSRERGAIRRIPGKGEVSAYFLAVNRRKKVVELNLKSESGCDSLWKLIRSADVLVENFRKGTMDRLGFGYEAVRAANPRLVYASIQAFREDDEVRADRSGFAIVAESESGVASHCIDSAGRPVWFGFPLGDFVAGLTAYGAIVTALAGRHRGGVGERLSISMVSSLLAMNAASVAAYEIDGSAGVQEAKDTAPYGYYKANDGYVAIAVTRDKFWAKLCLVMERPELIHDPLYEKALSRAERPDEIRALVDGWTQNFTSDECMARLSEAGVPCGRLNDTSDLLATDELLEGGYLMTVEDGLGGVVRVPANPMGYGESTGRVSLYPCDVSTILSTDDEKVDHILPPS